MILAQHPRDLNLRQIKSLNLEALDELGLVAYATFATPAVVFRIIPDLVLWLLSHLLLKLDIPPRPAVVIGEFADAEAGIGRVDKAGLGWDILERGSREWMW